MKKIITLLFTLVAVQALAVQYIHVTSEGFIPENRGTSGTPFEEWETDPNLNDAFGSDQRTMFLLVVEQAVPAYNEITENLVAVRSPDVDGKLVRGEAVGGQWVLSWLVEPATLDQARARKISAMQEDQNAAYDAGYPVGAFVFPFTETFFNQLEGRFVFMDQAIFTGKIQPDQEITFSDAQGQEVSVTFSQLRNQFVNYGFEYQLIAEKGVRARDLINAATTLAGVDAVTWNF